MDLLERAYKQLDKNENLDGFGIRKDDHNKQGVFDKITVYGQVGVVHIEPLEGEDKLIARGITHMGVNFGKVELNIEDLNLVVEDKLGVSE